MRLYTLDPHLLERARLALRRPHSSLHTAQERLIDEADTLCRAAPESVVYKRQRAAQGSAHDYYSLAPDAWLMTLRSDEDVWRQRDGITNPQASSDDYDAARLERMCERCLTLGLAWFFTGRETYAEAAAKQIRCWFLDTNTWMRPHLNFAHAVPGEIAGQGSGLVESRSLWKVIDTLGLIANANVLNDIDVAGMQEWFARYGGWMFHSEIGFAGYALSDWRGTCHDAQRVVYTLFSGDTAASARILRQGIITRLAAQFDREGMQGEMLNSERAFTASLRNIEAHLLLNRYAEQLSYDRWLLTQNGRSVRQRLDYLLAFMAEQAQWQQSVSDDNARLQRVLLQATRGFLRSAEHYRKALAALPPALIASRDRLLWYPGEQLLER